MGIDVNCKIPVAPDEAWRYFASPGALVRLSPPFMPLRPVVEAESLRDGVAVLEPRSALPGPLGVRFGPRWHARHDPAGYVEGRSFVDHCDSGPYAAVTGWVHHHTIDEVPAVEGPAAEGVAAGGHATTLLGDRVEARVPARLLSPVFAYRYRQMAADLAALSRFTTDRPLTVAVTGSSGLVGSALSALLGVAGHRVIRLVRGEARGPDERHWDTSDPASDLLDGVDVLVHLAGAPIAGRFTDRHLALVRDSRIGPTRRLAELVAGRSGATTLVCASAIGFYGSDRGDEQLTEGSAPGTGPVADIVQGWEDACEPARLAGARVVNLRTGVVLSGAGGMLPPLAAITRTGLGGRLGTGRQWLSWIALDDLTDVYLRAIVDPSVAGVVNASAPDPVTNGEFTSVLGSVLRRPTPLPVPGWAPGLILGRRGADELALADQRVISRALDELEHPFRYPDLRAALAHELGSEELPAAL